MPDIFISNPVKETKHKKSTHTPVVKETTSVHKLPGHTHNPLSAYCYFPDGARFINQDPEERIILLLRKHVITNVGWILIALVMIFAPLVLNSFPLLTFLPDRFQAVAVLIWYLVTLAFIYEQFLSWFFNVFIVTDERIIDVDFVNLVYREMSDANADKIQDVTVRMGGVVRTLFNYGDVLIQTAAEVPQIEFEAVPNPDKVARILRDLRIEEEQEKIEGRVR